MSRYDLAVWEGTRPATDAGALQVFRGLYDTLFNSAELVPATPEIQSYVAKLVDRWPDNEVDENCPWPHRPLIGNASGPLIYFAMHSNRAADVAPYAAQLAAESGLVCYDPQAEKLR